MSRKRHFTDAGMDCLRTLRFLCISTKPARPQSAGLLRYNRKRLSTSAGPDLSIVALLSISQADRHKNFPAAQLDGFASALTRFAPSCQIIPPQ